MPLTAQARNNIKAALDGATKKGDPASTPGLFFTAIDRNGEYLAQESAGVRSTTTNAPIDGDSVFWIASCTKMLTAIAVMQLVEQGRLDLDSSAQLYSLVPEVAAKREVLVAPGQWEPRRGDITMRMLLTHTAGFGYSFFNDRLREYGGAAGFDEFSGDFKDVDASPLVNQPGSRWEYGSNIDWAGLAVERLTGLKLGAYMQRHIFAPAGVHDVAFLPDKHMREHLVSVHQRLPGVAAPPLEITHPMRRAVWLADEPGDAEGLFHAGGAGLFAKPREYVKLLSALLNDGRSPHTGAQLLRPETVKQMFSNHAPQHPRFAYQHIPAARPLLTNPIDVHYPQEGAPDQGWGLSMNITHEPGATGRGRDTGWWAGIVNLFWWCDREKGVAGMIAGALYPYADPTVLGAWVKCEAEVYAGLEGPKM